MTPDSVLMLKVQSLRSYVENALLDTVWLPVVYKSTN